MVPETSYGPAGRLIFVRGREISNVILSAVISAVPAKSGAPSGPMQSTAKTDIRRERSNLFLTPKIIKGLI
jgi:hypothetical protein